MNRRAFLGTLTSGLLAAPLAAEAQPGGRIYRIGYLGTATAPPDVWEAFLRGLRDLGWIEGRTIAIDQRNAEGQYERLADLAADLVRLKVDIIVAAGPVAPLAAKEATSTIPIVMTNHGDPVGSKLVATLARPGANVTGLSLLHPTLVGKQIELLQMIVPKLQRVAILTNTGNPTRALMLSEAQAALEPLGVQRLVLDVREPGELETVFGAIRRDRTEALLILVDPMFFGKRQLLADLATKSSLPAASGLREFADAGILLTYGASLSDLFRRAATFVDKILKGAKPADLPIEQPTKFELVINLKTAKALGLTIPPALLQRADQVIE